ncbi:MAG: N-6 DNA methylase [Acidimicrobiales bacterium]
MPIDGFRRRGCGPTGLGGHRPEAGGHPRPVRLAPGRMTRRTLPSPDLTAVRTVGAALPPDVLARVVDPKGGLAGLSADDFGLELGVTPAEAANRAWSVLTGAYAGYRAALDRLPDGERATSLTRDKWLLVLLRELGFGRVPTTPAGGITVGERSFPVSHEAGAVPVHLLGRDVPLDAKTPGLAGAADRAPHAMVQELLNRSDEHLWAILANATTLRLLRDSSTLVGQSYVEFDLGAIFDGDLFADFTVLYLLCHQSRFQSADDTGVAGCWLERWRTDAAETGARALGALRDGVKEAIEALGTGFLRHPANTDLRERLEAGTLDLADLHRSLLRLVYRLLFLFVAEDRQLLLDPSASETTKARYRDWFSTARLRHVARRRQGSRHDDQWQALRLVLDGLGDEAGRPELGLPALGGIFENGPIDVTATCSLANEHLLAAIRHLSVIQPTGGGPRRVVDYRNLGAEELGGIYESLLEYVPQHDPSQRTFALEVLSGNDRKTSGAYYTPTSLIDCLLDSALDPLLDRAEADSNGEAALLDLTVCDPACGSGHFLVAAAKRIAHRLARVRAEGAEPTVDQSQAAMHDVVARCIYGVDLNPMAAELAKVSLWLESLAAGRPLGFLDSHIKVGNALLGTTPALLAAGIPDEAFVALEGDDKKTVSSLKKRNKAERSGQGDLFAAVGIPVDNERLADQARKIDALAGLSLADVHLAQRRQRDLDHSPEAQQARLLADTWCTAFMAPKGPGEPAITHSLLEAWSQTAPPASDRAQSIVERMAAEYRFFHWHLEFPQIFNADPTAEGPGWRGGFECVLGNPPWDTLSPDTREFFGQLVPGIRALSKAEKDAEIEILLDEDRYLQAWTKHRRQLFATAHFLKQSGRYRLYAEGNLGKGDFNTYRSFAEAALCIARPGGYAGQIMQSGLYSGANSTEIRRELLDRCTWLRVFGFNNKGGSWFEGVTLENFAAYTARVGTPAPNDHEIVVAFGLAGPSSLAADLARAELSVSVADLRRQNPETLAVPDVRDRAAADLTKRLYRCYPPFGQRIEGLPQRDFSREIDMSDKGGVFGDDPDGLAVYEGRMIDFFDHRAKRYVSGHGNSSVWEEIPFGSERKEVIPQWRVTWDDLPNDMVRDRCKHYRIGFMDVADPGRQRSFVSAFVPPGTVCGDKVPTLRFPNAPWYQAAYVAVANSLVLDFVARQRVLGTEDGTQHP